MVSSRSEWNAMNPDEKANSLADTDSELLNMIRTLERKIAGLEKNVTVAFGKHDERLDKLEAKFTS